MDILNALIKAIGLSRLLTLFVGLAVLTGLMGLSYYQTLNPSLVLLYGGLDAKEAAAIGDTLKQEGVPFEIRNDSSIYVPNNRVGELRLKVAGEGLVGGSHTGYEVFDEQSSFGTTSFVQDINARRALEGELARTIGTLPAVKGARVHVVVPKRTLFTANQPASTAAVTLNLGGRQLLPEQINAIAMMVAAAVPNLMPESVTIIDQRGNMLYNGRDQGANGGATAQEKVRRELEKDYETRLMTIIERVVGAGKVSVKVDAGINFEKIVEEQELYNPDQQVTRSEQRSEETSTSSGSGGVAGAAANLPGGTGGGASGSDNSTKTEETINYDISKTVRRLTKDGGAITKLSVAVLMEGGRFAESGEAGSGGQGTYTPMAETDIEKIKTLVRTAISFNEARGDTVEVVDMPFSTVPEPPPVEQAMFNFEQMLDYIPSVLFLIGVVLVIFMVVLPTLKALSAMGGTVLSVTQTGGGGGSIIMNNLGGGDGGGGAIGGGGGGGGAGGSSINIANVEGRVRESVVKKVVEVVDKHPEETVQLVRNWAASGGGSSNDQT